MSDNTTLAAALAVVCDFPRTPKRGDLNRSGI